MDRTYIGYCGWCVFHHLDLRAWQNRSPEPLTCGLDQSPIMSYSSCGAWQNILEFQPLARLEFSAHEWAELTRCKLTTFLDHVPTREALDDPVPP